MRVSRLLKMLKFDTERTIIVLKNEAGVILADGLTTDSIQEGIYFDYFSKYDVVSYEFGQNVLTLTIRRGEKYGRAI